jgi:hypothetical protein
MTKKCWFWRHQWGEWLTTAEEIVTHQLNCFKYYSHLWQEKKCTTCGHVKTRVVYYHWYR